MGKALKIRDLTLSEGQHQILGGRMGRNAIATLLPLYRKSGLYVVEVSGIDIPETLMRYLDESPVERLRFCAGELKEGPLPGESLRARTLFGSVPFPDYIINSVFKESVECGMKVIRLFDPLDDVSNMDESIRILNRLGAISDAALALTLDPEPAPAVPVEVPKKNRVWKRIFGVKETLAPPPERLYTDDWFLTRALDIEKSGAGMLTLSDFGGNIPPSRIFTLMPKLKMSLKCPVGFYARSTSGNALASALTAIIKGADVIDTNMWWFAGGDSAPALELILLFCSKLEIDVEADMDVLAEIRRVLKSVRASMSACDLMKDKWPRDFETALAEMPKEMDAEFGRAIAAAGVNDEATLLDACRKIENYFGFPTPLAETPAPEIPAEMYGNLLTVLKDEGLEDSLAEVLELIPKVRRDAGMVPFVEPIGSMIGRQAALLLLDRRRGAGDYTTVSDEFRTLARGEYGHTPSPVDSRFREVITGSAEERPFDQSQFKEPLNPELPSSGGHRLADDDEDFLLMEIFPSVAADFLRKRRSKP